MIERRVFIDGLYGYSRKLKPDIYNLSLTRIEAIWKIRLYKIEYSRNLLEN